MAERFASSWTQYHKDHVMKICMPPAKSESFLILSYKLTSMSDKSRNVTSIVWLQWKRS